MPMPKQTEQETENLIAIQSLNVKHLHLHFVKLDLLIRSAVRRWQLAGQDFSEKFRGLFISDQTAQDLLDRPIGGNWGTGVLLPEDEQQLYKELEKRVNAEIQTSQLEAINNHHLLRLEQLKKVFALSDFEFLAFLISLAPMLDTRYERIYGYLQDDVTQRYASISFIFDLLLKPGLERALYFNYFADTAPLIRFGLLKPIPSEPDNDRAFIRRSYIVPQEIISWLVGNYQPPTRLTSAVQYTPCTDSPDTFSDVIDLPLDIPTLLPERPLFILYGKDELQQKMAAQYISSLLHRPVLHLDLSKLESSANMPVRQDLQLFFRDALLNNAIPRISGWETQSEDRDLQTFLFKLACEYPDVIIFLNPNDWQINRDDSLKNKPIAWVRCELPGSLQRLQIWKRYLSHSEHLPEKELEILAGQFTLTGKQIQNAVFAARDLAFQNNRQLHINDLYETARQYSSRQLNSLAVKIEHRYNWEDIVLPDDEMAALREIANTIRWRSVVLEEWGVGDRLMPYAGISALFAGPPGTGKTLAAQVIAAELKMDLFKIDLSTVVSKYIGETEKNLERIFSQAKNSNAILFFDEADSIFGKRSEVKDAHDRYANIEVGYLLQRMETYDGIVILATNLRSNLDEAFTRRLQFMIDFPFPDEKERLKIWRVLFPPNVPRAEIDFEQLAERFKLTGGTIRNAIISASFLAASKNEPVSNHHLTHAIRRELQKMGRLINEKDLAISNKEGNNGNKPT